MTNEFQSNDFQIVQASWQTDKSTLSNLRRIVFILEQGVPQEEEWDGQDETAHHWLAKDANEEAIGTARLLPSGQIGRMAVVPAFRNRGVGAALLHAAVKHAEHLGFNSVFLNAQTHALGFYQGGGFTVIGDEFMEAGIAHYRMTRSLVPTDIPKGRGAEPTESASITLRSFDLIESDRSADSEISFEGEELVLLQAQQLSTSLQTSGAENVELYWQAKSLSGELMGVIQMDLKGRISRLAVLPEHLDLGVGCALLDAAVARATRFGLTQVHLNGLVNQTPFWIQCGFTASGTLLPAKVLEHQTFSKSLNIESEFARGLAPSGRSGQPYDLDKPALRLGKDSVLLLLRREAEFRHVLLEMCKQARRTIRIWSPVLDHRLFDANELRDIISALARRNRYTRVEMLLYDSHRVVKNGHALLDISRKLSSSISLKIVDPELRQLNCEFVLVDNTGMIYRQDVERYEGIANFRDITENNRLGRQFKAAWESGLQDPDLRQLTL